MLRLLEPTEFPSERKKKRRKIIMISIFHARSREKRLTDLSSLLPSLPRTSYKRFLSTIDLSMRDALVDFDVCYREQDLNNLFPYVLKIFIC